MDKDFSTTAIQLSVVVPCLNERDFIVECIESIVTAVRGISAELIIVDGGSNDGTLARLDGLQQKYPKVLRVLHSEHRYQVFGLNMAIRNASGEYIVRCDAHAVYPKSYFYNILLFYRSDTSEKYGNIGLPYKTSAHVEGRFASGIGLAMSSKLGVGNSHRTIDGHNRTSNVDTLLFGAWRRSVFSEVGLFDTTFIRGQDYEHNLRIRRAGMLVSIISGEPFEYFTRMSFRKMRRMIFQYAYVKGQLTRRDHAVPNFRSAVPTIFLLAIIATGVLIPSICLVLIGIYVAALIGTAFYEMRKKPLQEILGMLFAVPQMHFMHAAGFLLGLVSDPREQSFIRKAGHTR